ncbi:MAG: riboflavin synthase [Desulfobacteraceae bacterium 4572_35.1]|nr:MAG: riboflavin synthase [Desulfobacteraceae bacterium 4572_35.1]
MFTGLIEDVGIVRELRHCGNSVQLLVSTALPVNEIKLGDSVAVNGICLTVVQIGSDFFVADVSPETLNSSTLVEVSSGTEVNLERALQLSDRLGGHMVSGHVDAVASVVERRQEGNAIRFRFSLSPAMLRYVVEKGSITIDGISLTVNGVDGETFSVAIIPHSLAQTTLKNLKVGSKVNIETDVIARYVEKLLGTVQSTSSDRENGLTLEHLAQNGFM